MKTRLGFNLVTVMFNRPTASNKSSFSYSPTEGYCGESLVTFINEAEQEQTKRRLALSINEQYLLSEQNSKELHLHPIMTYTVDEAIDRHGKKYHISLSSCSWPKLFLYSAIDGVRDDNCYFLKLFYVGLEFHEY